MFSRGHHRAITAVLNALNHDYFFKRRCYFGGGTLLAMDFREYRESIDIDFLISDPEQIRALRDDVHDGGYSHAEHLSESSLVRFHESPK